MDETKSIACFALLPQSRGLLSQSRAAWPWSGKWECYKTVLFPVFTESFLTSVLYPGTIMSKAPLAIVHGFGAWRVV